MLWTLEIPGWAPCRLNQLLGHWGTASRLKAKDRETIGTACKVYQVPPATGKRLVYLHLVFPKGMRAGDPDSYQKSVHDALVHAGALKNDSHLWCDFRPPTFSRGEEKRTFITLQDL